jgi:hypothetical protein
MLKNKIKKAELSDFFFKKLGKMINDKSYDLNPRFAQKLVDAEYITYKICWDKSGQLTASYLTHHVTDKGKRAYKKWKNALKNKTSNKDSQRS